MPLYKASNTAILALANTWTAKQTFTPPANTEAIVVSGYSLTGANAQSLINLSGTWNTTGTPTAFKINITDTASNAASLLMDLQRNGTSRVQVRAQGEIVMRLANNDNMCICANNRIGFGSTSGIFLAMSPSGSDIGACIAHNGGLHWTSGGASNVDPKLSLWKDFTSSDADALGQRRGTNAQTHRLYATYTSSTDYHRSAWSTAKQTLSAVSGASVTATGLIPDGAIVVGVTTKVTTALGTTNGTTGYTVGDGSDADRWGAITGTAAGTSSDNRDWTATTVQAFTSAQDVVITATGGNFNGTGAIEVTVHYLRGESD